MSGRMKGAQRFVAVSCNHGDMVDQESAKAFMSFINDFKPEIRLHLGDNWDMRNLRKGASDDEKYGTLQDDWEEGERFLRNMMQGGKSNHFLRGNHSERIWQMRSSTSGVMRDYAVDAVKRVEAVCRKGNIKMLPYDAALGVLQLGHLAVLHGYHTGPGACAAHARAYGNCIFGHTHEQMTCSIPSLQPAEARSIGCLCIRDMDYVNAKTGKLRWAQGWAYGYMFPDGTYQLFTTRKINGNFYAAHEIKTY